MRVFQRWILVSFCLLLIIPVIAKEPVTKKSKTGKKVASRFEKSISYNPRTVVTITGPIVSIDTEKFNGRPGDVRVTIRQTKNNIVVHLAPEWYLVREDITITSTDILRVKGSKVTYINKPVILASEITIKDQVTRLRQEDGTPLWSASAKSKGK